ncbi:uncharacterized protein LOC128956161 [Oppia nitens]|uniref:uncharacterized protein LOC128956161 n=1 Tax=Oppia nitens TaxID=1686743 RepID=UPI0023DCAC58|nr:uncharacterized protein LOC128956161 [Oppia nitens]
MYKMNLYLILIIQLSLLIILSPSYINCDYAALLRCDNGKTNLQIDWDGSSAAYTCHQPPELFRHIPSLTPKHECDHIPDTYRAAHICMDKPIFYDKVLPTHESHRPIWPKFGEYRYVPPQRWVHGAEHGAVIMLYHPCADKTEIDMFKDLVVNCIRKHIITPNNLLDPSRPFAMVAWGCRLTMNRVDKATVIWFIKNYGMKGPEAGLATDGYYKEALIKAAKIPIGSDINDSNLCPNM